MPTWLYRPGHIHANERGFVTKEDYEYHRSMMEPDLHMMDGNKRVYIGYISDEMPPTRHMSLPPGSKPYTSKSRFRDETRAHNCIEVGDQTHYLLKPRQRDLKKEKAERVEYIKRAIEIEKQKMPKRRRRSRQS